MENVSNNPLFNYAQLYRQSAGGEARQTQVSANQVDNNELSSIQPTAKTDALDRASQSYSDLFADDELAKLQENLEKIANMADAALKKYER